MSYKVARTNGDIQWALSDILRNMKDPRLQEAMLTVISVDLSSDYSSCKVYVSSLLGSEKTKEAVKLLKTGSGFVRSELARRVKMRYTPEIIFIADNSTEHAAKIAKILKDIKDHDNNDERDS